MIRPKPQRPQHRRRNGRPHGDNDKITPVQNGLVAGASHHICKSRRQRGGQGFIPRRKKQFQSLRPRCAKPLDNRSRNCFEALSDSNGKVENLFDPLSV